MLKSRVLIYTEAFKKGKFHVKRRRYQHKKVEPERSRTNYPQQMIFSTGQFFVLNYTCET